jgi:hypothetical protein
MEPVEEAMTATGNPTAPGRLKIECRSVLRLIER